MGWSYGSPCQGNCDLTGVAWLNLLNTNCLFVLYNCWYCANLLQRKDPEFLLEDFGDDEKMKESGFIVPQNIPSYSWLKRGVDPPPNRYGIKPGRHWDGVDRSNGMHLTMSLPILAYNLMSSCSMQVAKGLPEFEFVTFLLRVIYRICRLVSVYH